MCAHCRRQVVDAIFYLVDNGTKWRALPIDFSLWSTVDKFFAGWEADGITQLLLDMLRERVRLAEGRAATPTAAIIDSQSVSTSWNFTFALTGGSPCDRPDRRSRRGRPFAGLSAYHGCRVGQ